MAITAPPELKYGYVVGKIVRTIADDIDADFYPDTVPASGQVTFKPVKTTSNTVTYPAIVMHEAVTGLINEANGEIYSSTGAKGVWLVTGLYDVVFNLNFGTLNGFQITVTESNTEAKPLDLSLARPLVPDPTTKFVVNEQVYINTLAQADRAKSEADRAASEVTRRLTELKNAGELTGPQGPPNNLSMGTVSATTGNPSAIITGSSPNQTLNLTLKTGATGAKGDQGIQGPANTLAIGTVSATTGTPSASITGTSPNQTLNLTLKTGSTGSTGAKGDKGDKGDVGPEGAGLAILGTLTSQSQLPSTGNPGDGYLINGVLWVWSASQSKYINAGNIQGPPGADSALPLKIINGTEENPTDFNTLLEPGIYPISSSTLVTNYPLSPAGVLIVTPFHPSNSFWRFQEWTQWSTKRRFIRSTNGGSTGWNEWREMAGTEVATSSADGLMSAADKTLLDTSTISAIAGALVKRDSNSQINVPSVPTSINHSTSKKYVDEKTVTSDLISDATTVGKSLVTATSTTTARTALGLSTGATSGAGTSSVLNTGTSTTNYVWTPKILADYVKSMVPQDTGWRNISSEFITTWGTVSAKIRRIGNKVTLKYTLTSNDNATTGNSKQIMNSGSSNPISQIGIVSGDIVYAAPNITLSPTGSSASADAMVKADGSIIEYVATGLGSSSKLYTGYREVMWDTDSAWPTTLPGTAL